MDENDIKNNEIDSMVDQNKKSNIFDKDSLNPSTDFKLKKTMK